MRRAGGLWQQVVSLSNLRRAAMRASRGKRTRACVARFLERLEPELLRLQRELEAGTYRPGRPQEFEIVDPKRRLITAAPFRDRVVHHALIDPLEPLLERRMVFASFACRRGKGQRRALDYAQRLVRRFDWFLKMDVRRCFPSLRHDVAQAAFARAVKDRRVLELCARIVEHGGAAGVGLPIGHLTSQWLCNLVLDQLDHWAKEELRAPGYVRYLDDFALLASDRDTLVRARGEVSCFLRERLALEPKHEATILAPAYAGMPFLGWRVYRGMRRLRPENLQRTRARLRRRRYEYQRGWLSEQQLADAERSVFEHLRQGSTWALRRRLALSAGSAPQT